HRTLGVVNDQYGLSSFLAGQADLESVIRPLEGARLFFVPAGPTPPNPAELVGSARMRDALENLRQAYDFVILDSPPVLPVTDAGPVLLGRPLRERRPVGAAPAAPGVAALAVFGVLALATTVPLPPAVLQLLEPASARLYAGLLPGWPGDGGWSTWRAVAFDPYAVWVELGRLSIACGIFAVLVGYPWADARAHVLGRLVLTFVVGGALLGGLALVEQVAGNGDVLWITGVPVASGRASGPFVNPNHF